MAKLGVHDDCVMEWTTHSSIMVKGHHHQEHTLSGAQREVDVKLGQAASIGHGMVLSLKVDQELWHSAAGKTEVQEGDMGEEEVHYSVQLKSAESNDGSVRKRVRK